MDIGKAFTYVFDDEQWITKVLIGGLFVLASIVLVGVPFVLGYMVQVTRNVMNRVDKPLPDWDNLGEKFREGLILALIFVIWLIPVWILSCVISILSSATGGGSDGQAFIAFLSVCTSLLSVVWGIVIALASPAIFIRFAQTPEFKSGFEFAWIWDFTIQNIGNIIIAVLLVWVAELLSSLGLILCIIGVIFTAFWAYLVQSHLFGQVYLDRKGGEEAEMAPPTAVV